jgi:hypothetical protein
MKSARDRTWLTADSTNAVEMICPLPVALPVIGNAGVGPDIAFEGSDRLEQFAVLGAAVFDVQGIDQLIRDFQGPIDLAVPQIPLQVLEHFLQVGAQLRVGLGLDARNEDRTYITWVGAP